MSVQGFDVVTVRTLLDDQNAAFVKKYYVNDAAGDPTEVYYAQAEAQDQDACLKQRLKYATVSGVKSVIKEAWEASKWNASWDI